MLVAVPSVLHVTTSLALSHSSPPGVQMMGLHVPAAHNPCEAAQSGPDCTQPVPEALQVTTRVASQPSFPGSHTRGLQVPDSVSHAAVAPQSATNAFAVPASEHK